MRIRQTLLTLIAVTLVAGPALAATQDQEFYEGLKERGLDNLAEAFRKQKGLGVPGQEEPEEAPEAPEAIEVKGPAAEKAKALADQALKARGDERAALFEQALAYYRAAIDQARKAWEAVETADMVKRAQAQLKVLELRRDLAGMVFVRDGNWANTHIEVLEITDKRGGSRDEALRLVKIALEQYNTILNEIAMLQAQIGFAQNQGAFRKVKRQLGDIRSPVEYYTGWATYYLGWLLPDDYQPPEEGDKRTRVEILNDSITRMMRFTEYSERSAARYVANLVVGQAHRALASIYKAQGKSANVTQEFELATQHLNDAKGDKAPLWVQIRAAFEKGQVLIDRGNYEKARTTIQNAREFFTEEKLNTAFGQAFPLVEAEAYILQGRRDKKDDLVRKGVAILEEVKNRGGGWALVHEMVVADLMGAETGDVDEMKPYAVWVAATKAYKESQDQRKSDEERAAALEKALELFEVYNRKAEPSSANYPQALYYRAAIHTRMGQQAKAGELFRKVAEDFPDFDEAGKAALYAVTRRGYLYNQDKNEDNRLAYEEALRWFVDNWKDVDPDQAYFLGSVLFRGETFDEAIKAYKEVPEDSKHFLDAKYFAAMAHLNHYRDVILPSKTGVVSEANKVVADLLGFVQFVDNYDVPKDRAQDVLAWKKNAFLNAAEVYMSPEVDMPDRALEVVERMQGAISDMDPKTRSQVLRLRIVAYQKEGEFDKVQSILDEYIANLKQAGEEEKIEDFLGRLFWAMARDVDQILERRTDEEAVKAIAGARQLADRFIAWLEEEGAGNNRPQINAVRYKLADWHAAIREFDKALEIYTDIIKPAKKPEETEPFKLDAVIGMARVHEGLAEASGGTGSRQHWRRAAELWDAAISATEDEGDTEQLWDYRYNQIRAELKLGRTDYVRKTLKMWKTIYQPFGGKDPTRRKKFNDMLEQVTS